MQIQRLTPGAAPVRTISTTTVAAQPAENQDLVQIGADRREMGLGRSIATVVGGGVGGALGTVAGTIVGLQQWGGVLGGVGGGVAGLVAGTAIGALIGNKSYSSSGDWI
ncbi:MAG: hypothetical protein KF760_23210 [Candidatus Eremiobacteraeota bacterium]|nr:hypothetical protein [Candidatus Eremiobacteraeota bacterium]MCW5870527.1 hypothetical protein [Candidatus Eremiobacteraeota bacterium]